jgi:hypothetical protein
MAKENTPPPQEPVVETAAELYREIKNRGLELRKGSGRDDALLDALTSRLGCPDRRLQRFLDQSSLSAESFLMEYLKLSFPFSTMSRDIWAYMSGAGAPKSKEGLPVRFSITNDKENKDIDLEQFRRYTEFEALINEFVADWTKVMNDLFQLKDLLIPNRHLYSDIQIAARLNGQTQLPMLLTGFHPIDGVVRSIYALFDVAIRTAQNNTNRQDRLIDRLPDLWPGWHLVFAVLPKLNALDKDKAMQFYKERIEPHLNKSEQTKIGTIRKALEILDLPFWKYRWQTFEIWSTVLVLQALAPFCPETCTDADGKIPFDDAAGAIVARLRVKGFPTACLALQVQTPVEGVKDRKGMKPDLRICFSEEIRRPENTAAIIEYKQQKSEGISKYLSDIFKLYVHGAPSSSGVIILNYDSPDISVSVPEGSRYIDNVQPGKVDKIGELSTSLLKILRKANFLTIKKVVLLDLSLSMQRLYHNPGIRTQLQQLKQDPNVRMMGFSEQLYDEVIFKPNGELETYGGTMINKCLNELASRPFDVEEILVVTDGKFDEMLDTSILNDAAISITSPDKLGAYKES